MGRGKQGVQKHHHLAALGVVELDADASAAVVMEEEEGEEEEEGALIEEEHADYVLMLPEAEAGAERSGHQRRICPLSIVAINMLETVQHADKISRNSCRATSALAMWGHLIVCKQTPSAVVDYSTLQKHPTLQDSSPTRTQNSRFKCQLR